MACTTGAVLSVAEDKAKRMHDQTLAGCSPLSWGCPGERWTAAMAGQHHQECPEAQRALCTRPTPGASCVNNMALLLLPDRGI
jgi:hypothetical protein